MQIVELKDKYRIETNKDVYSKKISKVIKHGHTHTGTYDDSYVKWLEQQIVNVHKTEKEECTLHCVSNSPITSEQRHQMWLFDDIERLLSKRSYTTEELELVHKVLENSNNFVAVIKAIKDCC